MVKRMLIIGRWCPFHNGHKYLVDSHLNGGTPVCVAVRDTKEKYTALQRKIMIEAVYPSREKVEVVIIPDIIGVAVGRGVGYFIAKVPEEIEKISATKIRTGLSNEVPPEVKELMEKWEKNETMEKKKKT